MSIRATRIPHAYTNARPAGGTDRDGFSPLRGRSNMTTPSMDCRQGTHRACVWEHCACPQGCHQGQVHEGGHWRQEEK